MKSLGLTQRLHVSWLLAAAGVGIVIGVIGVMRAPYGLFAGWMWLVAGMVLALVSLVGARRWLVIVALAGGVLIGLWRGSFGQIGLEHYQALIGQTVRLSGRVLEDPDIDKKGQTVLRLGDIVSNDRRLPGNVWVVTAHNQAIKRSDVVTVRGTLTDGFGAFAARMSRAAVERVTREQPGDVAVGVRDWFAERVRRYVPESEAALGLGFLMGLRRALPLELMTALQIAGLTHVIVASGYNLTILVRLARRLFVRVSKYLAALSAGAMIIGFMAMTGLSPSMSRAGLVAGLSLAAWYYGRTIHPLVLLPVAAAITLLINPQFGWNDLGWQLSFAAFSGVIILAPLSQRYFFGTKPPGVIRQIIGETVSAQIMTLPLLVASFGVISNVALIANVLILPLVPLAMLLTFVVGVCADVPVVAGLIAAPTTWLLQYMVGVAQWLAGLDWAQLEVGLSWLWVIIVYLVIIGAMWWMRRQTGLRLRESNVVE